MNIGSVPPELYYYGHSPIKPWVIEAYAEVYFTYSENMPDRYRTVPSDRYLMICSVDIASVAGVKYDEIPSAHRWTDEPIMLCGVPHMVTHIVYCSVGLTPAHFTIKYLEDI